MGDQEYAEDYDPFAPGGPVERVHEEFRSVIPEAMTIEEFAKYLPPGDSKHPGRPGRVPHATRPAAVRVVGGNRTGRIRAQDMKLSTIAEYAHAVGLEARVVFFNPKTGQAHVSGQPAPGLLKPPPKYRMPERMRQALEAGNGDSEASS